MVVFKKDVGQKHFQFDSEILAKRTLTGVVNELTFSVPKDFVFYPGQHLSVTHQKKGTMVEELHSISCASVENDQAQCLVKNTVGDIGGLEIFEIENNALYEIKVGSKVKMSGPFGEFFVNEQTPINRSIVLIGIGSRIAPIKSMVEYFFKNDFLHEIVLLMAFEDDEEILYHNIWKQYHQNYPNFNYEVVLQKGKANKYIMIGTIDELIKKHLAQNENSNFFFCGEEKTVKRIEALLIEGGLDSKQLFSEVY